MSEKFQKKAPKSNALFLSNVPPIPNIVSKLFDHFKNYGYIKSIWASGGNATIVYDTVESCMKAFNSPEAFANNRFVRYHYHNHPQTAESSLSLYSNMEEIEKQVQEVIEKMNNDAEATLKLQSSISDARAQQESVQGQ